MTQNYRLNYLALPRRTNDCLHDKILQPKSSKETISLATKLPALKSIEGNQFTRGKIGQKLCQYLGCGFDLTDSCMRKVSYDYNALHDPALKHFFRRQLTKRRLQEAGLLTRELQVLCSLREFNAYRQYLHERHLINASKARAWLDASTRDAWELKNAMEQSKISDDFQENKKALIQAMNRRKLAYREEEAARKLKLQHSIQKYHEAILRRKLKQAQTMRKMQAISDEKTTKVRLEKKKRSEREKQKRASLARVSAIKSELAAERRRLQRMEEMTARTEKKMQDRQKHCNWRDQSNLLEQKILMLEEGKFSLDVEKRKRTANELREKREKRESSKNIATIKAHFEEKSSENITKCWMICIRKLAKEAEAATGGLSREKPLRIVAKQDLNSITEAQVRAAVECSVRTKALLGIPISAKIVITESAVILRRIVNGYPLTDLPSDPGVTEFVKKDVLGVIEKIKQAESVALEKSIEETKTMRRMSTARKRSIDGTRFDQANADIGQSAYVEILLGKPTKGRSPTPKFHMKEFIACLLEDFDFSDDNTPVPERMNAPVLDHLQHFQKLLILTNLTRVRFYVQTRLGIMHLNARDVLSRDKITTMGMNSNALVTALVKSVMAFPELDENFGPNVIAVSDHIWHEIQSAGPP